MKKFLSLVLALVMTMSLVTISAGAKDFTDADTITYDEAVAVMSAVKVIDGYTDDSFKPTATLTRGAAAKIICNLILGPTTAAELPASVAPFKDVPANSTFAGYIAYCAKEGIVGGYADGTFKPGASLTGYAFMKMLLGALGYDAEIEGYNTPGTWSISVAKQALGIGLNAGLLKDFNGVKAVTREEACLYAFNTLKATMVDYDTKTAVNVGDATVVIAGSTAKPVGWDNKNAQTGINNDGNIKKDGFVQFAEQYFTKLKGKNELDVFGRPSRTWDYKGDEIGTYVAWDLQVGEDYKAKVTGKDLYDLLGRGIVEDKDYDVYVYIDGEDSAKVNEDIFTCADMNKNNKDGVGATGDGVLTQVFVSSDTKEAFVCIINTYLAKASADYSEKKDEVSFNVWGLDKKGDDLIKGKDDKAVSLKVSGDDFAIEDVEKNDVYLVQVAEGEIQTLAKAEVVADTEISAFKLGSSVTAAGEKYDYADTAEYDIEVLDHYTSTTNGTNLKDVTYNIYLDPYGNLIGVDLVEVPDNYVFITGMDSNYSNLANKTYDASAIFLDGTMEVIKVKSDKGTMPTSDVHHSALINKWCTYTVDKNGVYTLSEVPGKIVTDKVKVAQTATGTHGTVIDKKHISLPGTALSDGTFAKVYGNDNTVYLTASIKEIATVTPSASAIIIDGVDSVTTGIKNANIQPWTHKDGETTCEICKADANGVKSNIAVTATAGQYYSSGVYTLYKDNGYIIAAVVVGEDAAASKNLVYVTSKNVEQESYDKAADEWTWTRKVAINGEEAEIKEVSDSLTYLGNMKQYNWYQVKYNADGEVIAVLDGDKISKDKNLYPDWNLNANEYVTSVSDLETAINAEDTVLYSEAFNTDNMTMIGNVLYATSTKSNNNGFYVSDDVKVVLTQTNQNKTTTTYETGAATLKSIVDTLNEKGSKYDYVINAVIEDGAATTVVIYDATNTYNRPADTVNASDYDVQITGANITNVVYHISADSTEDDLLDVITNELETVKGLKNIRITYTSGIYHFTGTDARGIERTYNWTPSAKQNGIKLVVDGVSKLVAVNNSTGLTLTAAGATGVYSDVTLKDGTKLTKARNTDTILWASATYDGAKIDSGYVKLTSVVADADGAIRDWTVSADPAVNSFIKKGDTVKVTVSKIQDFNDAAFGRFTWTVTESTDFNVTTALTQVGEASTSTAAKITFYATLKTDSADVTLTVKG